MRRPLAILIACLAIAAVLEGCSDASSQPAPEPTFNVVERDFAIKAPREVAPGEVRISIENKGPDAHEFIVVRSDGKPLPLRKDGMTVDEDAVENRIVAALEPELPGSREVDATLAPGRYVMICNMSGHLMGGMKRTLVVG
jgi:uncharacterized cupredoxin-like copper-binding protein